MVRYMPQLVEAGKVYKAIPPLYATKFNGQFQYYIDATDFAKFVQKSFIKTNSITYPDGTPLSNKDMLVLFMTNEDYAYYLESLASTYGVDPYVLEFALINHVNNIGSKQIEKDLKKRFRFMKLTTEAGNLVYDGTTVESNFLPINNTIITDCKPLIDIMRKNISCTYVLNGQPATIYDIMTSFNKSRPAGVERFKGLGEMKADKLEAAVKPSASRQLIRYTFEDAKAEIEAIREFESDTTKLLNFVGTVKRTDLLD